MRDSMYLFCFFAVLSLGIKYKITKLLNTHAPIYQHQKLYIYRGITAATLQFTEATLDF